MTFLGALDEKAGFGRCLIGNGGFGIRRGYALKAKKSAAHALVVGYIDDNRPRGSRCSGNANSPAVTNFGQLFTDKANSAFLNQASLTVQRPLDPKATGYDFGFKFQAMLRFGRSLYALPG